MTKIPDEKRTQRRSFWETGMRAAIIRGMGIDRTAMSVLAKQLVYRWPTAIGRTCTDVILRVSMTI